MPDVCFCDRLAQVAEVRYLAPDPLFAGVQDARHLNEFIASRVDDLLNELWTRLGAAAEDLERFAGFGETAGETTRADR